MSTASSLRVFMIQKFEKYVVNMFMPCEVYHNFKSMLIKVYGLHRGVCVMHLSVFSLCVFEWIPGPVDPAEKIHTDTHIVHHMHTRAHS